METRMADQVVWCLVFFLTLFEMIGKNKMTVEGNSHAFIQANNEVRYLVDGLSVPVYKEFPESSGVRPPTLEDNNVYSSKYFLKFDPPLLDFKERQLGIPHHEKVTLFNINNNKTIHMSSISGNTVHFHSSFFEDKVIPPLGNTTFNVVFLGREEGEIESNLFIHTSEGKFKYQVRGASISSPYRLRPFVGIKVPLNATFAPLIYIYNPHPTPMQVLEVYSSGGEFHLELPSGELEGPKHLWEIPPFQTKPVIRTRFVARAERNHTAYVRIKVNKSEDVLVVPLEVDVSPYPGLYSVDDTIDMGIGGSFDKPKQIKLLLYNSCKKSVKIQNIVTSPISKAMKVHFKSVKVPPDSRIPTQVAILTFDWKAAFENNDVSGKIIVKSKQGQIQQQLTIPYIAHVLEGGLGYNASVTQYCSDSDHSTSIRNFTIHNMYRVPVAIYNISLPKEVRAHFVVHNFTPIVVGPDETKVVFQISLRKQFLPPDLRLESHIQVFTNLSTLSVPVLCYNGRLDRIIVSGFNESVLNFGTIGSNSKKEAYFALINNNPVPVHFENWGSNLTSSSVDLIGVDEGNYTAILSRHDFCNMSTNLVLQPGHYAIFRVSVLTSATEGDRYSEVYVRTQFEKVTVPARLRIAHGHLEVLPQPLILDDCFPGKLCVQQLHVRSLFSRTMAVTSITSVPPDDRISYVYRVNGSFISPLSTSPVGELHFNPAIQCSERCYLGTSFNSSGDIQWLQTLSLPPHTNNFDISLLSSRYSQYQNVSAKAYDWQNLTFRLDTTEVRDFLFQSKIRLIWPKILYTEGSNSSKLIAFPLSQVGRTAYKELSLNNPSSSPLLIQLAMEDLYPHAHGILSSLPKSFHPQLVDCRDCTSKEFTLISNSSWVTHLERELQVPIHKESVPFLLQPGETITTRIAFSPRTAGQNRALLFIRNNLTVLEVVQITGKAAFAHFKFGSRKPGSEEPLLFELTKKHLKDCEREKNRKFPAPNLTVKRSFTARNTGELPIIINGFWINDLPCEGYGFRIMNCSPFILSPNASRKIDIAFTSDFTLARVQRLLIIETSLGMPVNYSLITTLPSYFLVSCSLVLSRPSWEPLLYYSAVSFMLFLKFCVLAAAFVESDHILKCALVAMAKEKACRSTFDCKHNTLHALKHDKIFNLKHHQSNCGWSFNNITGCHNHDKRVRDLNGINNSKSSGWSQYSEKRITEPESQDRSAPTTKYDISEAADYSHTNGLTVKSKKRLSKKNSNTSDTSSISESVQENSILKKGWNSVFSRSNTTHNKGKSRLNLTETKISNRHSDIDVCVTKKVLETPKEVKKSKSSKKNMKIQPEPIACSEEDTSSTTTESSNNDETDKERESSSFDQPIKSSPKKEERNRDYKDNYEGDCDDDDYEREGNKKKDYGCRWKPSFKSVLNKPTSEVTVKLNSPDVMKTVNSEYSFKLKTKNAIRERKEKNVLKKRLTDKTNVFKSSGTSTNTSNSTPSVVRASPPLRTNVNWGEQKATFSDVVSRTDNALYSNIVAPRKSSHQSVPSVFSDNGLNKIISENCSSSSGLGPIGSKKPYSHNIEVPWSQTVPHTLNDITDRQIDNNLSSLPIRNESLWDQSVMTLLEEEPKKVSENYPETHTVPVGWPRVNHQWEPINNMSGNDMSLFGSETRYPSVWANSVWSSTWSPSPNPQILHAEEYQKKDEWEQPDNGFNPFNSMSTIWFPSTSNTWSTSGNK